MTENKKRRAILIAIGILSVICIGLIVCTVWLQNNERLSANISDTTNNPFGNSEHYIWDEEKQSGYIDNELIVAVKGNTSKEQMRKLAEEYNAIISGCSGRVYFLTFNQSYSYEELKELVKSFESFDFIDWAMKSDILKTKPQAYIPNDPKWDSWDESNPGKNNWGLEAIHAPTAWEYKEQMNIVNIGVCDGAFYYEHEDLKFAECPANNPEKTTDSHGTHVAGTIAAEFDNNIGISGVSPNNKLFGVATNNWVTPTSWITTFEYLIKEKGCKVINISLGHGDTLEFAASRENSNALVDLQAWSQLTEETLLRLIDEGYDFVICKSAGNQWETDCNKTSKNYRYRIDEKATYGYVQDNKGTECGNVDAQFNPLSYIQNEKIKSRIIVVGAVQNDGHSQYSLANFSQRGERVDVTAPGVDIYSTVKKSIFGINISGYENMPGTSMATPHVSGLAAMLFGVNPELKGPQVKEIICETANPDAFYLIDAGKAVEVARTLGSISGEVYEKETGEPMQAKIEIYSAGELYKTLNSYDETGAFSVNLPAGTYDLVVSKYGYTTQGLDEYRVTISLGKREKHHISEPFVLQKKERTLTSDELKYFEELLSRENPDYNNAFLTCVYTKPSQMDLDQVLYTGGGFEQEAIQEERNELIENHGYIGEGLDQVHVAKLSVSDIDSFLLKKTGLTLDKFDKKMDEWTYVEKYDAYFSAHNDTNLTWIEVRYGKVSKNKYTVGYTTYDENYEVTFTYSDSGLQFISNQVKPQVVNITEEEAIQIGEKYWDVKAGEDRDPETGFLLTIHCQGTEKIRGRNCYALALRWLVDENVEGTHWCSVDWVYVDTETGECTEYTSRY